MAKRIKKSLGKEIEKVEQLQKKEFSELKKVEKEEQVVESEIKKFEQDIEKLRSEIKPGAVEKFTYKDIARGIVGAIFGMSIMGWHDAVRQAAVSMSVFNLAAIVVLTVIAGSSVLYFSQYKRIKERWIIHHLLPKRFVLFYLLSLIVVFVVYVLFNIIKIGITPTENIVKLVIVVGLPAMIGAGTADIVR